MNIIKYNASAKLSETTSNKNNGLHTNAFNVSITSHTFENGMGTIEFNGDVTTIGDYAFYGSDITNIGIPKSVTSIGLQSFDSCVSLTSVTIPDSVTSIGGSAFSYSGSLTSVTIGNSVTSIGEAAFTSCTILSSVIIIAATPPNLGTRVFDYNANNCPIYVPAASVETYKATSGWSTYASRIQAMP